jgi:hypothetical protein
MARGITSGLNTEVTASELEPIFLIDLEFDSGTLYFWTGVTPLTWDGNEYIGGGNLIGISPIAETSEIRAVGVNLTMSGLPASLISIALTEAYQGQPVKIRFGALSGGSVVADPYLIFDGRMDVMTIDDTGETAHISLSAESRLIDLDRPRVRRYTPEDQKAEHPNDTGLDYVPVIPDVALQWGR